MASTLIPSNILCRAVLILLLGLLVGCLEPPTPEEAGRLKYRLAFKGTGLSFDIPVTYDHSAYVANGRRWFRPPEARREVERIDITALLPDLEPFTAANAKDFDTPGWGRKVRAAITRLPHANWDYYFANFAYELERLQDSPDVPGMLHYRNTVFKNETYLSHDHAVKELIYIDCDSDTPPRPWPSCKVQTLYRGHFYFEYVFWRKYLPQWREIDRKLNDLFDQFAKYTQ